MAIGTRPQNWQRALVTLASVFVFLVVLCALYWARTVFIPIALAIFLAFVLTPLVRMLERLKLGRLPSVFIVIALATSVLAAVGFALVRQAREMANELPAYSENIKAKSDYLMHLGEGSALSVQLRQVFEDISSTWEPKEASELPANQEIEPEVPGSRAKPMHVVVEPEGNVWMTRFYSYLNPLFETLGQSAFAVVLVIFMLCKREDLRNRFLWLVGHGHLTRTTRAVDEVVQRLSRYLFVQFSINVAYGLMLSFGLWLIGVNHAFLWGALGGALRYVPYIGAPFAALFPIALSTVQFPGWIQPLEVIALIGILEVVTANVVEPLLFGHSMGISEVTLLISAAIWTFLWGPIGLVLAMPIMVCLVVIGEYVPGLEFVAVLLSDRPALKPHISLYQRLTAHDQDEATNLAESYVAEHTSEPLYDELLIPVLTQARQDAERSVLADRDLEFVLQSSREISEDLGPNDQESKDAAEDLLGERVRIVGLSARDEFDRSVLEMLEHALNKAKWDLEIAPGTLLASEVLPFVTAQEPAIICISCLRPGGLAHTRYLCKRLRAQFPDKHIMVCSWGHDPEEQAGLDALLAAGADRVETSIRNVRDHLNSWRPVLTAEQVAIEDSEHSAHLQSV